MASAPQRPSPFLLPFAAMSTQAQPRRSSFVLTALAGALIVTSCKVGPDYEEPVLEEGVVEESFAASNDPAFKPGEADLSEWWSVFNDPVLTSIIERAEAGNKDLKVALARVEEARTRVEFAKGARFPALSLGGGAAVSSNQFTGFKSETVSSLKAEAAWELDVFGRIARQIESDQASFEASEEDLRDVRVTLLAEVARSYISVRALQMQLKSAEENLASQKTILELTRSRAANGISSDLDLKRSESLYAASEAALPPLRVSLTQAINTLGVLIGKNPTALQEELRAPAPIPVPPGEVTVGVPADLLRQRPDIRGAERRLAAQTARVGVATADLYPTFGIGGTLGIGNRAGGSLLGAGNTAYTVGPGFTNWTIFSGGRIRNLIKAEDIRVEQALLRYESTVLNALLEVETALASFTQQGSRVDALARATAASNEALNLATGLYEQGLIDYEQLLNVQRDLLTQDIELFNARGEAASALVLLYRSMGGGWSPDEVEAEPEAEEEPPTEEEPAEGDESSTPAPAAPSQGTEGDADADKG